MFLALAAVAAASAAHIEMSDIQARLFYSETGRLSDDLLARKKQFVFWNTIIGEGDAEENADDLLVSVTLSAGKFGTPEENEQNLDAPLTIKATDEKGQVLGMRTARNLLTGRRGSTTVGLWLNDVTCAGAVTVQARYADQVKTAVLKMACGE
jgi:hypothetical protein